MYVLVVESKLYVRVLSYLRNWERFPFQAILRLCLHFRRGAAQNDFGPPEDLSPDSQRSLPGVTVVIGQVLA